MTAQNLKQRKTHKIKPGPVRSPDGIPYDYIVVIDAGSKGSRAYVYNWLNPQYALNASVSFEQTRKVNLGRRIFGEEHQRTRPLTTPDSDSEADSDPEDDKESMEIVRYPHVSTRKKWHRAIKPGLSSFNESPQKVGKHHMSYLLNLASSVVPKSEHHRTPIYVHSTAGMRLLPPNEQEPILENVCRYLRENSDFFVPDCKTHVNIIDGNVEGLYGWLSINYLLGSFDRPQEHQQGKNHTTYGVLDMGGSSTQVVFSPNKTETEEHKNNLYKISLYELPQLSKTSVNETGNVEYLPPNVSDFDVFSDSFLGFGMYQAHNRYLKVLLQEFRKAHDFPDTAYRFRTPIPDPCLPKGYTFRGTIDNHHIDFTGKSDFSECLRSIFPVLENNSYALESSKYGGNCRELGDEKKVSSCLLSDMIPSFDFEINHFIGVSGYWDIVNKLLASQTLPSQETDTENYDYRLIYQKTQQICSSPLNQLLGMNDLRHRAAKLKEEELAELCFKASWILNFLHVGLGFPRFGIDKVPNEDDKFKSLKLMEKVGGSSFSWTLGRAILYANDEYAQAYNNHTKRLDSSFSPLSRPGYVFSAAEGSFTYGAEAEHVDLRPVFSEVAAGSKFRQFDYENNYSEPHESKWNVKPHRVYGLVIFMMLFLVSIILLIGKGGRSLLRRKLADKLQSVGEKVRKVVGLGPESQYGPLRDSESIEMSSVQRRNSNEDSRIFRIDDENE